MKFGVSDASEKRLKQVLKKLGNGAYAKTSSVKPKWEAHLHEKYLRSLLYNAEGIRELRGMKIPYPRDFNTGEMVKPKK